MFYTIYMTLTELAYQSRIIGKVVGVFAGVLLLLYLVILVLIETLKPPVAPTIHLKTSFGPLEKLLFEQGQTSPKLKYILDTVDGELPVTTASAAVYYIPELQTTLVYLNKIATIAQSFGFDTNVTRHEILSDEWVKYEDSSKVLTINIKYFHFKFQLKPSASLQKLVEATPSARFADKEKDFIEDARQELQSADSYPPDLATGKINQVYMRYDLATGTFVKVGPTETPSAIRIDFFRKDEKDMPVMQPGGYLESKTYVILAPLVQGKTNVTEMQFIHFDRLEEPGVYPLITVQDAWEQLQADKATLITLGDRTKTTVNIKKIFIGYYDPGTYQKYFQPIFVFYGDNDYVSYLPAVTPEYILGATESASLE